VFHVVRGLEDKGRYLDSHQVAQQVEQAIYAHVRGPLVREAYRAAVEHYALTAPLMPGGEQFLRALEERERELEEKLRRLEYDGEKLGSVEARSALAMYRALTLIAPRPTLGEIRELYEQLIPLIRINVGEEGFIPVHGPVGADMTAAFNAIAAAGGEEWRAVAEREMSRLELRLYMSLYLEKIIDTVLEASWTREPVVPVESHRKLISYLERARTRIPI